MKISLLINELNIRGGTHKQFLRLCEYLKKQNIDFEIITKFYDKDKTYPEFKNFDIKFLGKDSDFNINNKYLRYFKNIFDTLLLLKLISKNSKICNIHDNGMVTLFPILKFMGKKIVWQVNDLPGYFSEGNSKNTKASMLKNIVKSIFQKITIKYIDEITVNVTKNAERIKKHLKKDSEVFYCGIDSLKDFKIHKWKEKETINLLTTGVFVPYRNYETIIEVVNELKLEGFNCKLDIIGDTTSNKEYSNKIFNLVLEKKLEENVKIHGQVLEKDFKLLFDNSDIFLFLNVDQSWGLVVFEAMSVGFPTIVSKSVGAVEILNDNVALIVDPFDIQSIKKQIIELHKNSTLYDNYANLAFNHVKNMSWDNMYCKKMLNLFNNLKD